MSKLDSSLYIVRDLVHPVAATYYTPKGVITFLDSICGAGGFLAEVEKAIAQAKQTAEGEKGRD